MGRRRRRKESQRRAQNRVRGRVRQRVQGRPGRVGTAGRRRSAFDVGAIEDYANRLADDVGGTSGLASAASGLAGAASGLAGSSFAHRILEDDAQSSEEDFKREVRERLDLLDQRLQRLEDQMQTGGDVQEPESGSDPDSTP